MTDSSISINRQLCRDYLGWIRFWDILPFINKVSTNLNHIRFVCRKGEEYLGNFEDIITKKRIEPSAFVDVAGDELFNVINKLPLTELRKCIKFMDEFVDYKEEELY